MYNRLFLTLEAHDGKNITKKIVDELEEAIPEYRCEYIVSAGYEKKIHLYPKCGKGSYSSFQFQLVYIPHGDKMNFAAFNDMYGDQRNHNYMRLLQLRQFLDEAEKEMEYIERWIRICRKTIKKTKSVLKEYDYMVDLLDRDDRDLIKSLTGI